MVKIYAELKSPALFDFLEHEHFHCRVTEDLRDYFKERKLFYALSLLYKRNQDVESVLEAWKRYTVTVVGYNLHDQLTYADGRMFDGIDMDPAFPGMRMIVDYVLDKCTLEREVLTRHLKWIFERDPSFIGEV